MIKSFHVRPQIVSVMAVLLLSGCGWVSSINPFAGSPKVEETKQTASNIAPTGTVATPTNNNAVPATQGDIAQSSAVRVPVKPSGGAVQPAVEVIWQVPSEAVEIYHLSYGHDPKQLDRTVKIPVRNLEKIDHPAYGPIFHYQLADVDPTQDIYISLRAENTNGISEPTPPMKIAPNSPKLNR